MEEKVYQVWLAEKESIDSEKLLLLLAKYATAENIYKETDFVGDDFLEDKDKKALLDKNTIKAEGIVEKMKTLKGEILFYADINYPRMLRNMINAPKILYARGLRPNWDKLITLGVVGTRHYTDYGERAARIICQELAKAGITIVSGMARGIDSIAASAALDAGGATIAVLGCGVDVVYPPENEELMQRIMSRGTVFSEYPPGTRPDGWRFPQRNRIISGLSKAVFVPEAPLKSGALITVNHALENGIDVFAVPGDIFMPQQAGTNRIIQQGAKLITCASDILEEFEYDERLSEAIKKKKYADKLRLYNTPHDKAVPVSKPKVKETDENNCEAVIEYQTEDETELKIIGLLKDGVKNIDELIRETGLSASIINIKAIMLEMNGVIERLPGNDYILGKGKGE